MKIRRITGTTSHYSDDVIYLQRIAGNAAACAFAFLRSVKPLYVLDGKRAAIGCFASAADTEVHPALSTDMLTIRELPSLKRGVCLSPVLLEPSLHFVPMARRVFRTTFSGPLSFKSWSGSKPTSVPLGIADNALPGFGPARTIVTILAWLRSHVSRFASRNSGEPFLTRWWHLVFDLAVNNANVPPFFAKEQLS